jgi:hypothetical protein
MGVSRQTGRIARRSTADGHAYTAGIAPRRQTTPVRASIVAAPRGPALRPTLGLETDSSLLQPPRRRPSQQGGKLPHLKQPIPTPHIDHDFQAFLPAHQPQPPYAIGHIAVGSLLLIQRHDTVQEHPKEDMRSNGAGILADERRQAIPLFEFPIFSVLDQRAVIIGRKGCQHFH